MKVTYINPNDNIKYNRWYDDNGSFDIWYNKVTRIFDYKNAEIPEELKNFLSGWDKKINEYKKTYREMCPVKLAHIEFIYKDIIYSIYPITINATYKTDFMSDTEYDVSWDSLFETYEHEIRKDLKNILGVVHSRYFGMID